MRLANAHAVLAAAYGWPASLDNAAILERLLSLNLQRSGQTMQPKTQKTEELEATFNKLAETWYKEASYWSFSSQRAWHTAYMKIINLGKPVLPLIFRELEASGNSDWHHALEIITGENPVPENIWGKRGAAESAWLDWAREQGYRW